MLDNNLGSVRVRNCREVEEPILSCFVDLWYRVQLFVFCLWYRVSEISTRLEDFCAVIFVDWWVKLQNVFEHIDFGFLIHQTSSTHRFHSQTIFYSEMLTG